MLPLLWSVWQGNQDSSIFPLAPCAVLSGVKQRFFFFFLNRITTVHKVKDYRSYCLLCENVAAVSDGHRYAVWSLQLDPEA